MINSDIMLKEELADFIVGNKRLAKVVSNVDKNKELNTYWVCSNINALDRLELNDHGRTHIKIISKMGLQLLRLLSESGVETSIVKNYKNNRNIKNYGLDEKDSEVVVFLASCLHDIGHIIHRECHRDFSLFLASDMLGRLLDGAYNEEQKVILKSEILHCILTNHTDYGAYTVEAEVARIADKLDMAAGRSKITLKLGNADEHAVSAQSIKSVQILKGKQKPVAIYVRMKDNKGMFQVNNQLRSKLNDTSIRKHISIIADVESNINTNLPSRVIFD